MLAAGLSGDGVLLLFSLSGSYDSIKWRRFFNQHCQSNVRFQPAFLVGFSAF